MIYKKGELDFDRSPAIKKDIIDNKKCEVIILVILYPNFNFSKIEKKNIYIFDQNDFKHFKTNFCWSGNSKGDKTIVNIISIEGELPPKRNKSIEVYTNNVYKELFKTSKGNWKKVESLLK